MSVAQYAAILGGSMTAAFLFANIAPSEAKQRDELAKFYVTDRKWKSVTKDDNDPNDNSNHTLTAMSYNILASGEYTTSYRSYCKQEYLEWDYRWRHIYSQIAAYKPDIITMQEPTMTMFNDTMENDLKENFDMIGIHAPRVQGNPLEQSDALFVRKSKFNVISHRIVRFGDVLNNCKNNNNNNNANRNNNSGIFYDLCKDNECYTSEFWQKLSERPDVCIIVLLETKLSPKKYIIVVGSHLYWDPKYPDVKAGQAYLLNNIIYNTSKEILNENNIDMDINDIGLIVGIDANAMPLTKEKDKFRIWINDELVLSKINEMEDKLGLDKNDMMLPLNESKNGFTSGVYTIFEKGELKRKHCDHVIGRFNVRSMFDEIEKEYNDTGIGFDVKPLLSLWREDGIIDKEKEYSKLQGFNYDWQCPMQLKSVYKIANSNGKEPMFTTQTDNFKGCIDYIWINDKLDVVSVLDWPNDGNLNENKLYPNKMDPSDHLPLVAKLRINN